jgi:carbon-monoxide dehydrogenase medium subunit
MVAAAVSVAPSGDVRIALINVSDRPVRAIDAEAAMRSGASIEEVAAVAVRDLDPPSDLHATPAYRRKVAAVLVRRALTEASTRARSAA